MTQADPWGAASIAPTSTPVRDELVQGYGNPAPAGSSLSEGYAPEPAKQSSLFGPSTETLPSMFTLAHAPGTVIRGTIIAPPKDVQSTCHPTASPDRKSRLKQYWCTDPTTGKRGPGIAAVDPATGRPNDPVMNLVISVQTDQRDAEIPGDDGRRAWFVQGSVKPPRVHQPGEPVMSSRLALMDAIKLAGQSGVSLTSDEDMIGKTIMVNRVRREQPSVQTSPWFWQVRITAA